MDRQLLGQKFVKYFQRNDNTKIIYFGILIHILSWRQQNSPVFVLITKIIWWTFDVIIDDP